MKSQTDISGVFGKLPAHGDFVQRNLPAGFINVWDGWLQHFIAGTKEQLGESWLDVYLTSPLWRFVFSAGVIDENVWTGIMIPSVDRVGRYYPFSIIKKLEQSVNPFVVIQEHSNWYTNIETLALDALDGQILIDDLMTELENYSTEYNCDYSPSAYSLEGDAHQFDMAFEEQSISSVYPLLLDTMMTKTYQSYSVWQTTGSDYVNPCLLGSQGLPGVQQMPAMLNGEWKESNWQQPFSLDSFIHEQNIREEA